LSVDSHMFEYTGVNHSRIIGIGILGIDTQKREFLVSYCDYVALKLDVVQQ